MKNATQKPLAGNRTRVPAGSLNQRSTDRATEAVTVCLGASSVYTQLVMPVKNKDILKIVFGIHSRCQQMKPFIEQLFIFDYILQNTG